MQLSRNSSGWFVACEGQAEARQTTMGDAGDAPGRCKGKGHSDVREVLGDEDGRVLIYYASSDTRLHLATSTVKRLVDYCLHTPKDGFATSASVETVKRLINKNRTK